MAFSGDLKKPFFEGQNANRTRISKVNQILQTSSTWRDQRSRIGVTEEFEKQKKECLHVRISSADRWKFAAWLGRWGWSCWWRKGSGILDMLFWPKFHTPDSANDHSLTGILNAGCVFRQKERIDMTINVTEIVAMTCKWFQNLNYSGFTTHRHCCWIRNLI